MVNEADRTSSGADDADDGRGRRGAAPSRGRQGARLTAPTDEGYSLGAKPYPTCMDPSPPLDQRVVVSNV